MRVFRLGDTGPEVLDIQQRLIALGERVEPVELIGTYGPSTAEAVRAFQRRRSLRPDGLVGPDTWEQLVEAGYRLGDRTLYLHAPHLRGDDVRALQAKLNALGFDAGRQDGMFGSGTDRAVREFQRNVGEESDGVVGLHFISILERMRPYEGAASRALVREEEELRWMRAPIEGQLIAIDPGVGPDEGGDAAATSILAVAHAVAHEIGAAGAKTMVLGGDGRPPNARERANAANEHGAAICVAIDVVGDLPEAAGPTCSYFGTAGTHSPAGQLLASLILEEVEAAIGARGRLQRLTTSILRETRMPAVQIDVVSLSNVREAAMIDDPQITTRLGHAIAAGVRRFFRGDALR